MRGSKKKAGTVHQDLNVVLKKIGKKLIKQRKARGFTSGETFAFESGVNRSQYGKYEAGSQNMRFSILLRTINALGMTFEEFFKDGLD